MNNSVNLTLPETSLFNGVSTLDVTRQSGAVVNLIFISLALILFSIFLIGSVLYFTSNRDINPQRTIRAKRVTSGGAIGFLTVFAIFVITKLAELFFGITLIHLTIASV